MKALARRLLPVADVVMSPLVYPSALLLKLVRRMGVQHLPFCKDVLLNVGVFPIRDHYYEPQFRPPAARNDAIRPLPGVAWNAQEQLALLERMTFADELQDWSERSDNPLSFRFNNGFFESGDAEYWHQIVRLFKPRRIYEIGCGYSTLIAAHAIRLNREENAAHRCEHVCIEPYEQPWLERLGVQVIRQPVETLPASLFAKLEAGDVLFIDSSHVIRPRGDVLFEYLEVLPTLASGVVVHVHDIFSPRNYPRKWLVEQVRLWNEQYLLEAFLSHNNAWKILGALNYLHHEHPQQLKRVAPFVTPEREPCSFYMQKIA